MSQFRIGVGMFNKGIYNDVNSGLCSAFYKGLEVYV